MRQKVNVMEQSLNVQVAVLAREVAHLRETYEASQSRSETAMQELRDETRADIAALRVDIVSIKQMADRWRGATALLLGAGSAVGAIISAFGNPLRFIK